MSFSNSILEQRQIYVCNITKPRRPLEVRRTSVLCQQCLNFSLFLAFSFLLLFPASAAFFCCLCFRVLAFASFVYLLFVPFRCCKKQLDLQTVGLCDQPRTVASMLMYFSPFYTCRQSSNKELCMLRYLNEIQSFRRLNSASIDLSHGSHIEL